MLKRSPFSSAIYTGEREEHRAMCIITLYSAVPFAGDCSRTEKSMVVVKYENLPLCSEISGNMWILTLYCSWAQAKLLLDLISFSVICDTFSWKVRPKIPALEAAHYSCQKFIYCCVTSNFFQPNLKKGFGLSHIPHHSFTRLTTQTACEQYLFTVGAVDITTSFG